MLVKKFIIEPGTYWYMDQDLGLPRRLVVTQEGVQHFHDDGNKMISLGLSVPVPLEHQPEAVPLTAAQRAAKQLRDNSGWVSSYVIENGALFALLDIQDADIAKKLPKTIRWTSPWISSFTDGDGRAWNGVISHVALTTRPRITKQPPFPNVAAAMSYAETLSAPAFQVQSAACSRGFSLSRAGLLRVEESGICQPVYPMAFSLYSGTADVQLASAYLAKETNTSAPMKKAPAGKGKPDRKEYTSAKQKGLAEETPEKPEKKPPMRGEEGPPEGMDDEMTGVLEEVQSLVDADGDISVYAVLQDLLSAVGIELPEGTTAENFCERLYGAAMEKVKMGSGGPEMNMNQNKPTSQPPTGQKNDLSPNPIIQEQHPVYMSQEAIDKIADPQMKSMAQAMLSMHQETSALRQNAFDAAKRARQKRIDKILPRISQASRDRIVQKAQGAGFSLGADGVVKDEMGEMLDILEDGLVNMPQMMTTNVSQMREIPHPEEYTGSVSEERRQQIVEEFAEAAGLPRNGQK